MLEVDDLHAYYGKSHILHGVSLRVDEGEIVSLLGRNGVGRSTTIKAVMGDVQAAGSVRFRNEEICGLPPYVIARKGLGYVPENRDIFPTLTVRQNLLLGVKNTRRAGRWSMDDMFDMFPALRQRADNPGGVLSGGEQQMLTICRTLMGDPHLIMVDEPTSGMSRSETEHVVGLIRQVTAGKTLLMVEHDMSVVFDLADRIAVLVYGEIIAHDTPERIRASAAVQEAYLGVPQGVA